MATDRELSALLLAALEEARAFIQHWTRDVQCGLKPLESSLATAEARVTAAIVKAEAA